MNVFGRAPDSYDLWLGLEEQREKRRSRRPMCDYCGEPVDEDFYYEINGEIFCEYCLDNFFRKAV